MITPTSATIIIVAFIIVFGVGVPALEHIPAIKTAISYRWAVMVTLLAVMLGCVLDFSHINDQLRLYTIISIIIISGVFILIRSIEKTLANGWHLGIDHIHLEKGDIKGDIVLDDKGGGDHGST